MTDTKVLVIGLDCLTPQLLFDRWLDELPTFKKLVEAGSWGKLKSVNPPITVPAWSCMTSGYQPAQLGLYGFRHREMGSYDSMYFADSRKVNKPRIWERLSEAKIKAGVIGVPQTYPVKKVKGGYLIAGFLAPSTDAVFTFPDPLREELEREVGPYILDVKNFRADDRARILEEIRQMTDRRFDTLRYLLEARPTDFTMMVEMGSDRIHHAFWRFTDPEHPRYEPDNPWKDAVLEYYKQLDAQIARTLEQLDDDYHILVVSDHGARPMIGGFAINDWLQQEGYLQLKEQPDEPAARLTPEMIDFSKTKVWAWGGYYARVFLNVEGREPQGQIPAEDYESFLQQLREELGSIVDDQGEPMGNIVMRPQETAADGQARGDAPDLMVYFGDLAWRSIGSVNHPSLYVESNDTGPDDANHDHHGILIHSKLGDLRAGRQGHGEREDLKLIDVGPSLAALFDLPLDEEAAGRPMEWMR